ncbi:MAG: glycosyl hydrolase, partial [Parabacteroides sp.]|nr:glycosyl hydrolase [Parabacteroides sp.]
RIKSAAKVKDDHCHIHVPTLILSPVHRVELSAEKSGYAFNRYLHQYDTPESQDVSKIEEVIDLTNQVKEGVLTWDAPAGDWRIFRFGYSLTGSKNGPASPEATGLEVDKINPDAIRRYYQNYLDSYVDVSGGMVGEKGITHVLNDSFEGGAQTWTNNMVEEFQKRRGYSLLPWLPALTGMIINSSNETERFLFDWRKTIGEMMVEYHYDLAGEILKEYDLKRYTESHEYLRANLTDGMDCKRYADIPMSSFWMHYKNKQSYIPKEEADIRESASIAHIYGQNIVAAESFSTDGVIEGALLYCPSNLKSTADAAMAFGLNRFVIHTSPHQPEDDKFPGISLGKFGQWFTRHETWAEQAHAWTDYLSRSCYLLQQGQFVADIAYYYGEDNNVTCLYYNHLPIDIKGYNYDFVNPNILMHVLKVENGMLTSQTGMKYRALYLDKNVKRMS